MQSSCRQPTFVSQRTKARMRILISHYQKRMTEALCMLPSWGLCFGRVDFYPRSSSLSLTFTKIDTCLCYHLNHILFFWLADYSMTRGPSEFFLYLWRHAPNRLSEIFAVIEELLFLCLEDVPVCPSHLSLCRSSCAADTCILHRNMWWMPINYYFPGLVFCLAVIIKQHRTKDLESTHAHHLI